MRLLYLLGGLMLIGLFLMFASSYKVLDELHQVQISGNQQAEPPVANQPGPATVEVQSWLAASYIGMVLFAVGGVGGIIVAFRLITRRF